ncbi:MAG: hypothetical protein U1F05_11565 [Burkholderiales bacterium]
MPAELRDDLNDSVTDADTWKCWRSISSPNSVFDALFEKYSFASHNPMSKGDGVLDLLQAHRIGRKPTRCNRVLREREDAGRGHRRAAQGKQKIVVELYDKFFRNAS